MKKLRIVALFVMIAVLMMNCTACKKDPAKSESEVGTSDVATGNTSSQDLFESTIIPDKDTTSSKTESVTSSKVESTIPDDDVKYEPEGTKNDGIYASVAKTKIRVPVFEKPNSKTLAIKKGFEKAYNCTLNYEVYSWNDFKNKLIQMVSAGTPPDLCVVPDISFIQYASKGVIQPIDDYIDKNDSLWDKYRLSAFSWKGKCYAANGPYYNNSFYMYYNKNLTSKLGIDPYQDYKNGNWTWDVFTDYAKKLTQDTNKDSKTDIYGFGLSTLYTFSWSNGGTGVKINNGKIDITMGNSNELAGFDLLRKMYCEDKSMCNWADWSTYWQAGKLAFLAERPWNAIGEFDMYNKADFKIGLVPLPKQSASSKDYLVGTLECFGVPKGAKNPLGAMAYLHYKVMFEKENANSKVSLADRRRAISDEHLAIINEYTAKATKLNSFIVGVNNWDQKSWAFFNDLFNNTPAKTAFEKNKKVLENEIALALK